MTNHCDRHITPPSDTDISLQSETYHDMSDRYITVRDNTMTNHCDRRITPPSDTDISLRSETYHDMSDRYITVRGTP
jgi:hypothetical protein